MLLKAISCLVAVLLAGQANAESSSHVDIAVNWPAFMARQDLVWEQLPRQWNEGAFIGNGQLGIMLYATLKDNRLDFHLGRADVTDHRKAPDRKSSMGMPGAKVFFDFCRLDIGRMALRPAGKILDGSARLDLWNAEITATVKTDLGELKIRALTPRDRMVQVVEVSSTERNADGSSAAWKWEFLPGNANSPRAQVKPEHAQKENYQSNPPAKLAEIDGIAVCVQELLAGGDYATAWCEKKATDGRGSRLYISTANEVPAAGRSAPRAVADVCEAATHPMESILSSHRNFWHSFYPAAFLSIPDARLESFYWIQIYKLASAWSKESPAIDLFGPWFRVSQWPGIWWNLNIQLTYWPVYAGNRLEIGENFLDLVDQQFDTTFVWSFKGRTIGDFTWALHNYWWQLRFAGDWSGIQQRWFPKAKRMAAAFTERLERNAAGKLGLPNMGSPEFHGFAPFDDTNYNLGLLRWLLDALIEADARSGQPSAPEVAEWKRIRGEMVDYPTDANGLMIGSNQPMDESHRHFSHLLPFYPVYQMDSDDAATRDLLIRSAKHWHQIGGGKALSGYSFTVGAAIYASLGLGNEALGMLNDFFKNTSPGGKVVPNTMYVETGGRNPTLETPLSAASATTDMLLQSWQGKIRVFPAVPDAWSDAVFHHLRAMDGFLVSAKREAGKTVWVVIRSEAGEPCVLKVPDWLGKPEIAGSRQFAVTGITPGEYRIDLKKGEEILLRPQGSRARPVVKELPAASQNPFGVKRGQQLIKDQSWSVGTRKNR